MQINA